MKNKAYSVVYNDINDPSAIEVNKLIEQLEANQIVVKDQFEGCILIEGNAENIKKIMGDYKNWSFNAVVPTNNVIKKYLK